MKIKDLRSETGATSAKVAATVIWEDCDRPAQEIHFETDLKSAADLSSDPHAFLIACVMPAMLHGEARLAINEKICPDLKNGLETAMRLVCRWYGPPRKPLGIEAASGGRPLRSHSTPRAGSFLSGGVDSLATLRLNRLDFPASHPRSIKDCLFVYGFDMGSEGMQLEQFSLASSALTELASDVQATVIAVKTNLRELEKDLNFWIYEFHGAALSSVAHAFSRLSNVSIASSDIDLGLMPYGSHPLLDPLYSSAELQIRHDAFRFTRLEKVRLVADWDLALRNLRVCTTNPVGMLNCGSCEKCIRTMTQLLAIGKLRRAKAFPVNDVSRRMLENIAIRSKDIDAIYRQLIDPLKSAGRHDLADVITAKSREFQKHLDWLTESDWKGIVKRLDRRYFGSRLARLRNRFKNAEILARQTEMRSRLGGSAS